MNDLKPAFHRLFKVPGFTLLAVLTLALGLAGIIVPLLLGEVTLRACCLPARKTTRVDPMVAL